MKYNPDLHRILWLTNSGWHYRPMTSRKERASYRTLYGPYRPYWYRFPKDPGDSYICEINLNRAQEAEVMRLRRKYPISRDRKS